MRKGQGMFLADIAALFLIAFLLFGFLLLLLPEKIIPGNEGQRIFTKAQASSQVTLLNFLRSPVEVKGETMTTHELIAEWYLDRSLEDALREHTKNIFFGVYGVCYGFTVSDQENIIFQEGNYYPRGDKGLSQVVIPLADKQTLMVTLNPTYFFKTEEQSRIKNLIGKNAFQLCGIP